MPEWRLPEHCLQRDVQASGQEAGHEGGLQMDQRCFVLRNNAPIPIKMLVGDSYQTDGEKFRGGTGGRNLSQGNFLMDQDTARRLPATARIYAGAVDVKQRRRKG